MITVVGGTKEGGSGKSTVATNLTVMLAAAGRDVLLVDADDQETSSDFTAMRNETRSGGAGYTCVALTGRAVMTEVKRLAPKYQEIVVDTGGRDTVSQRAALAICDTYLVPFAPRSFDVWTLDKVAELSKKPVPLIPTCARSHSLTGLTPKARTTPKRRASGQQAGFGIHPDRDRQPESFRERGFARAGSGRIAAPRPQGQ